MASRALTAGTTIRWSQNRGRNGWDVPTDVDETFTTESMNVLLQSGTLGKKRRGSAALTFTGDTFAGFNALFRFVPAQDDTAAQMHAVSTDATTKIVKVAAGTAAVALTLKDAVASLPTQVRTATLNGKLFYAYDSTVNRLHVYDPATSTTAIRRVGLALPAAPTVADQGGGGYALVARYYRVAWRIKSGSTIVLQSNLGAATAPFTPTPGKAAARVTQPTTASEGETHWVVYGSADNAVYYELQELAIGTTYWDDSTAVADYDMNEPSPDEGAFTPFPSVKMLVSTGERLLGLGVWESSAGDAMVPHAGRVYFTPVLDTTDYGDDERCSNTLAFKGWIDVARNAGAEDRALAGPLDGVVFAFQSRGAYMLVPTGEASKPFRRVTLSTELGSVSQEATFMGEDESGAPCLYWLDPVRGPYRYGRNGLQWCGYDLQDLWPTINLAATTRVAAGVYDPELRACIWGVATGASNVLNEQIVFFVREGQATTIEGVRGGWVRWQEASASSYRCCALLPTTFGNPMTRTLKPHFGNATTLLRQNDGSSTQDNGASFQGYVTSKAHEAGAFYVRKRLGKTYLQATAQDGVTITQGLTRNFGEEAARTSTVDLTPDGSETRVLRRFEDAALADAQTVQVQLGDSAAANTAWTLDEWVGTLTMQEEA